jgi:hypothetical protein
MRRSIPLVVLAVVLGGLAAMFQGTATATTAAPSAYVAAALKDAPVALLQGTTDLTGATAAGTAVGQPTATTLPNGDPAVQFNGNGQYLQFPDSKAFEVDATGVLTVEFWMRPDTLQFTQQEGSGYVYTMGKGNPNAHEWYTRMYSKVNQESRPNRISGYVFNPQGGLGAGSYFQDTVTVGQWIHVALVINANAKSSTYPMGYTRIYKNGVLRDTDSLADYNIVPKSGTAPLRIGTGYLNSFFQGAVGDVAFYNKELSASQLQAHYAAISAPAPAPTSTTTTSPTPTPTPAPTTTVTTWSHVLNGTNVARGTNQLIRYTPAYGASTRTNTYGFEAAVVGGKITLVQDGVGNMAIPSTGYVLSGHGDSRTWLKAHALLGSTAQVSGSTVTITTATN